MLQFNGQSAEDHYNHGCRCHDQGRFEEAAASYEQALILNPDFPQALINLGNLWQSVDRPHDAIACYERALQLDPANARCHNNLGNAVRAAGNAEQAVAAFERAIQINPAFAEAYYNLGDTLRECGRLPEAADCFQEALRLKPDFAAAYNNLGGICRDIGRRQEAGENFQRALQYAPELKEAHVNWAYHLLQQGLFRQGWEELEWRLTYPGHQVHSIKKPLWDRGEKSNQRILVLSEQGIGDTIQFARYAMLLGQSDARVIFACQRALLPLFRDLPVESVVATDEPLSPFDAYVPLLSLPRLFHTTLTTIPATVPYLSARPELVREWGRKFARVIGFRVGINWCGSGAFSFRDIPLTSFAALSEVSGVRLISLQVGPGHNQLGGISFPLVDLGADLDQQSGAFVDTAAVMMNLDLVVTSDTSVAHLAGALGVPVWLVLPVASDWRWLLDRDDSPWYPTMRLFRQANFGQWGEVFGRVAQALLAATMVASR